MSNIEKSSTEASAIEGIHFETGELITIHTGDGLIREISGKEEMNLMRGNLFVAPGLIDNQINGYAGIDFSGSSVTCDEIIKSSRAILKKGVTTFLPTLITSGLSTMVRSLKVLSEAWEQDEIFRSAVPGFHLEGPYISSEDGFRGCHPEEHIRKPSVDEFKELYAASGNKIIQITVAPEAEGAMELIKYCSSEGIIVALGHTNASASEIRMAADNGARLSTHLGNGCTNMIHRHYNPLWPQLAEDRLTPSIIADGLHLLPEEINVFLKVKGAEKLILTSDIVYLADMAPGTYSYLGTEVLLTESGMLKDIRHNCLAGATFPLIKGVETMIDFTGCSLAQAINMASRNVARIYKLNDRGVLSEGARADLILFEKTGDAIKIKKTYLKGKLVFDSGDTLSPYFSLPNHLNWG